MAHRDVDTDAGRDLCFAERCLLGDPLCHSLDQEDRKKIAKPMH